ncbi:MAG: hypothetical protein EOP84_01850 [Verrucomicrobiaceae bacterium]|nr:MAG: hypothetical protein EOP84_01850 [Verrucomicrobiaceae bacterium]
MGPIDVAEGTRDEVEITNLRVGYDFDLRVRNGLASITGSLYAGLDADIYSDAETFTLDVSSFFVGGNLEVDTILDNDTDTFLLRADSFFVFNGFDLYANIYATGAPADAVSIDVGGVFSVGGDFLVQNDGTGGKSVVVVGADIVDIGGRLLVDNISQEPDEFLSLVIDTDVLRLNEGLTLSSKSPASSSVDIDADLAIINGPVTAKLSKSGGDLSIVADNLTIQGNVNFAVKETGHLLLQGSGDVFGKVSASLGSGSGTVQVLGSPDGELAITGLSITTPKKLPATASGAEIAIENVVVFGKAKLKLGRGGDLIDINDSVFFARATISTGAGGDTVNIHTNGDVISEFRAGLNVTLGTGNDFLNLGREEAANANTALFLYGAKKFDGGSGTDLYSAEGRNVQFLKSITKNVVLNPKVRGFEPGVIVS